jgi:serine O-acetyltransferase
VRGGGEISFQSSDQDFPSGAARPRISSAEFLSLLREDYATNRRSRLKWTFFTPGFQAIAVYRLGVWCNGIRPWILRAPIRLVAGFLSFFVRNFYGIEIYPTAQIGRRFGIVHQHGIVIHKLAVIGDDCLIRQGVTIGAAAGHRPGTPRLGNRVMVGAGAVIAGPISIGDHVSIGPNAVVMTNVPAGSTVTAPQSRIMPPSRIMTAPASEAMLQD